MIPHHRIDGEQGSLLVLSSSLGATLSMWDVIAADLARDYRVLRYDHRGHGRSAVPPGPYSVADLAADVLDLLDSVGEESASFCGLSLGGCVGQWLGANASERIDRLVLACTSPTFGPPQGWHERAAAVRASGTESIADAVIARWLTPEFAAGNPEVVAGLRAVFVSIPDDGYAACCEALADWDFVSDLPRISPPTLIVAGDVDPAAPPEDARLIADRVPDSRLVFEHAAHLAPIEQPAAFTREVRAHLR